MSASSKASTNQHCTYWW